MIGILAALLGRERGGEGASLDISMHEAALYWVMLPAARDLVEGGATAEDELPTFGGHACYNVYRTRDGEHVALGALEPKFWPAFCDGGRPADLAARHLTGEADQAALIDEVRGIFAGRTRDEWLSLLEPRRLPHAGEPPAGGARRSARRGPRHGAPRARPPRHPPAVREHRRGPESRASTGRPHRRRPQQLANRSCDRRERLAKVEPANRSQRTKRAV